MKNDHRLDNRSPLVLDITALRRRAGEMKSIQREVPAPAGLGIELIRVAEGSPIDLDLQLESVVEGVLVTGTASADLVGECARCLVEVTDEQSFDLSELYYYPGKDAEEDANWVENDTVDLEPALRDAIVLDLPFTPLCRDDCAGLCAVCGQNLNDDPSHSHDEPIDARWEKLADFASTEDE